MDVKEIREILERGLDKDRHQKFSDAMECMTTHRWYWRWAQDLESNCKDALAALSTIDPDAIRAEREELQKRVDGSRDEFLEKALEWRGISFVDEACDKCGGSGVVAYGSTATWHGGIGGQAITSDVCDKCWGSGSRLYKWADLRKLRSALAEKEE